MRGALLFALSAIALLIQADSAAADMSPRPQAMRFELQNLAGRRVRLQDHQGKVVVVALWAVWCTPCHLELNVLNDYYLKYKAQGFEVLAVSLDGPETSAGVRSIVQQRGWQMPVLRDQDGSVGAVLNPRGNLPYSLFVDREGRIAHVHEGFARGDEASYEALIKKLLAEGGVRPTEAVASAGPVTIPADESFRVRLQAIRAIGDRLKASGGPPPDDAIRELGKAATSDQNHLVRASACLVLGNLGDPRAMEHLMTALGDENPLVQKQAEQALEKIEKAAQPH